MENGFDPENVGRFEYHHVYKGMIEHSEGDWVRLEDYEKLLALYREQKEACRYHVDSFAR